MKDNWDDEEEEETSKEADKDEAKSTTTVPKKKKLKQTLAEKAERERREREERLKAKQEVPKTKEEELAEKLELQRLQEESDLMLAKDAFGVTESKSVSPAFDAPLSSKDDFDAFQKSLIEKLQSVDKNVHYVSFLENLFRELCVTLEADDIKRISGNLNALFNEKVKAQKASF